MNEQHHFSKRNYQLIILSIVIVVLGYFLMSGGATDSPNEFNPEQFNFLRLTLAPTVILIGYGTMFVAILKNFNTTKGE